MGEIVLGVRDGYGVLGGVFQGIMGREGMHGYGHLG